MIIGTWRGITGIVRALVIPIADVFELACG